VSLWLTTPSVPPWLQPIADFIQRLATKELRAQSGEAPVLCSIGSQAVFD